MPAIKQQEYPKRRFVAMSFVTIKSPGVRSLVRSKKLGAKRIEDTISAQNLGSSFR